MKWSIPEKIIEQGRQYVQTSRVLSAKPDRVQMLWHAEVLGTQLYQVALDGTSKENDLCSCPYWQEHHFCRHTVAVELYLKQKGISRMISADSNQTVLNHSVSNATMFTKGFSKLIKKESKTFMPLIIEFFIEDIPTNHYYPEQSLLGISLRIGYLQPKKKTYIVKNMAEFLQTFQQEGTFVINKRYFFELKHQAFSIKTKELLEQLTLIFQTNQLLGVFGVAVSGKVDKRYLVLPVKQGQQLLEQMSETGDSHLTIDGKSYKKIEHLSDNMPVMFTLEKVSDTAFKLSIQNPITLFLSYYHFGFVNNQLFNFSIKQEEIYLTLLQLLKRLENPEIVYQKEELPELFTVVLPLLRKIGNVTIDQATQLMIKNEPLQPIFIFKRSQEMIDVEVQYVYGNFVFSTNPLHEIYPPKTQQVIRQTLKEQAIQTQLEQFGYQRGKVSYKKKIPQKNQLYRFFKEEIPVFKKLGDVKMGTKLRSLFLDDQTYKPEIHISDKNSWLEVQFDIAGIEEDEIQAVLTSLLKKQPFHTLKSGELLALDSELFVQTSEVLNEIRGKAKPIDATIQMPKNQGLLLADKLTKNSHTYFSDSFKQMVYFLTNPQSFHVSMPKNLQVPLRKYQEEGFRWLKMLSHYQFGGILADEMGLGKTIQLITYLLSEKEENSFKGSALIVVPSSLTYNWLAEIQKFAPTLVAKVVTGNKEERKKLLASHQADLLITSYATLRQDLELYKKQSLGYLILDEAQMIKNSKTKTAQVLRQLDIPQKFALSGTPIENNVEELWSIFQVIVPGLFPAKTLFQKMKPEEIASVIQPFILRRDKKEVLADLPDKIETDLYSSLTAEQKTVYLAYLQQIQREVQGMNTKTFQKNRLNILTSLTRLRQICCDPHLFLDDYHGHSGKLEQLKELLLTAKESRRRILLFSQFTGMLEIIKEELDKMAISTFYLHGGTKAKERIEMVNAFNAGEKDVFLISLKAGGTGLNLTGADTVILYDLWWNPAVENQATSRAHRMGQKKVVEIWRMIAKGTIEEKINTLQKEKKELFEKVIEGNQTQLSKLNEEDIRTLLSIGE